MRPPSPSEQGRVWRAGAGWICCRPSCRLGNAEDEPGMPKKEINEGIVEHRIHPVVLRVLRHLCTPLAGQREIQRFEPASAVRRLDEQHGRLPRLYPLVQKG